MKKVLTCRTCSNFADTSGRFRPCKARPCLLTEADRVRDFCEEYEISTTANGEN